MSVVVAPKVSVDEPKVIVGFAKLAFEIPALPDKLEFVTILDYAIPGILPSTRRAGRAHMLD